MKHIKIIDFENGKYLARWRESHTPLFEFIFHCDMGDLEMFTGTEMHTFIDCVFAKYIVSQQASRGDE